MTNLAVQWAASAYQCVYTCEALVSQSTHFCIAHARPTMFYIWRIKWALNYL